MSPLLQERSQVGRLLEAVDGTPPIATVAAVKEPQVIDEAGIATNPDGLSRSEDDGVDTSKAWVLGVEGNDKPVDAEFHPLHSACEEHTCPWNFAEGGRDAVSSNVQLRNANGLSILSGRRVMVSYDVFGPGGRVILHAQTLFVQNDVKRPLVSVGKLID